MPVQKNCLHCDTLFQSKNDRLFCSRKCYDDHRTELRPLCLQCGDRIKPSRPKTARFCTHECRVLYKKPAPRSCISCGAVFTPIKFNSSAGRFVAHNSGKTCSFKCQIQWIKENPERKRKIGEAFKGGKHPNWQGGKSALNTISHRGSGWTHIAEKARIRDKHVCQHCGKTQEENGRKLDVHHITPYHEINDAKKANRLSNLVSLCQSCHTKADSKLKERQMILPFAAIEREKRHKSRTLMNTLDKVPQI